MLWQKLEVEINGQTPCLVNLRLKKVQAAIKLEGGRGEGSGLNGMAITKGTFFAESLIPSRVFSPSASVQPLLKYLSHSKT